MFMFARIFKYTLNWYQLAVNELVAKPVRATGGTGASFFVTTFRALKWCPGFFFPVFHLYHQIKP